MESACPGCGLVLPSSDGPTHAYIGASPACWALYGELLVREYGSASYRSLHRLTADTYAVQHPGRPEPRAIRSVAVHLTRLCLVLERDVDLDGATRLLSRILERMPEIRWLEPPQPNGTVTVADVLSATTGEEHETAVRRWAEDVWAAWALHAPKVRRWLDGALSGGP